MASLLSSLGVGGSGAAAGSLGAPVVWLKPESLGPGPGDPLLSWPDASAYGNDAVPVVDQPTVRGGGPNGSAYVEFVPGGVNGPQLLIGHDTELNFSGDFGMFAVCRIDSFDSNGRLISKGSGAPVQANPTEFYWGSDASQNMEYVDVNNRVSGGAAAYLAWGLVELHRTGTTIVHAGNGAESSTALTPGGITASTDPIIITAAELRVDIAEIIMYAGAVSGADKAFIRNYLNGKYILY